ncbi:MAG: hypothetical protein QOJ20_2165, partial [Mycobacterium sp.]|nr:hypothetical protein [Mycobacterium sp.]
CLAAGVGLTALVTLTTAMQWGVVLRQRRRFGWVQIGWHLQSLFFASIVPVGVGGDAMRCAAAGPRPAPAPPWPLWRRAGCRGGWARPSGQKVHRVAPPGSSVATA